jgi:hypothetical protein
VSAAAGGSSKDIQGRFLGTWSDGLAGHEIVVEKQKVSSDGSGAFKLSGVSPTYDLAVLGKNGAQVSVYLGLSRRDPVVALSTWPNGHRGDLRREAHVTGRVAGPELSKTEGRLWATLHFFSALRPHGVSDSGFIGRPYPGDIPEAPIGWAGPPVVSGRMLVFIRVEHTGELVGIASKSITLEDGDSASEDLTAVKLSSGHVVGTWNPARNPLTTTLTVSYALDDASGEFGVANCKLRDFAMRVLRPSRPPLEPPYADQEQPFDCPIRDVGVVPGRYRISVMDKDNNVLDPTHEPLTDCSIRLDNQETALPCQRAAAVVVGEAATDSVLQFSSLAEQEPNEITSDSVFAWKRQPHSVYAVDLEPLRPYSLVPWITLYTSKTRFRWSDLNALGIGFPAGAVYSAMVFSVPVSSVDGIASSDWWYGQTLRSSRSAPNPTLVKLTEPGASIPDPQTTSNVYQKDFPSGLPACPTGMKGQVLSGSSIGHRVTITGLLSRQTGGCIQSLRTSRGCDYIWVLTDVPGSSLPVSLGKPAPHGDDRKIPVAATGLLQDAQGPRLEHAILCLMGRAR